MSAQDLRIPHLISPHKSRCCNCLSRNFVRLYEYRHVPPVPSSHFLDATYADPLPIYAATLGCVGHYLSTDGPSTAMVVLNLSPFIKAAILIPLRTILSSFLSHLAIMEAPMVRIDRTSSIEREPRTLSIQQIQSARVRKSIFILFLSVSMI